MLTVGTYERIFTSDKTQVVGGSSTAAGAIAGNAWVTMQIDSQQRRVEVVAIDQLRTAGASATNHQPLVADVTGSTGTAWATKVVVTAAAPTVRIDETNIGCHMFTDADGKVFYTPGGDAADSFKYSVTFRVAP